MVSVSRTREQRMEDCLQGILTEKLQFMAHIQSRIIISKYDAFAPSVTLSPIEMSNLLYEKEKLQRQIDNIELALSHQAPIEMGPITASPSGPDRSDSRR